MVYIVSMFIDNANHGIPSGLQRFVAIKIHNVAVPMGSHGLHCL